MCFSLDWLLHLCIWLVVVFAVIAIIKLLLPMIALPPVVSQIILIVLWAAVSIFVLIIIFSLLSCLFSGGGLALMPHR